MITESKIKIPDDVLFDATRVILSSIFGKLIAEAESRNDEELLYFALTQFRQYNKNFFPLSDNNGGNAFDSIKLNTKDLPAHYQKKRNRIHTIHFYASFDNETTKDAANYQMATKGVASVVHLKLDAIVDIDSLISTPTEVNLKKAIVKSLGFAIHELSHAVQDKSFGLADKSGSDIVDSPGTMSAEEYDKWALDPDEFHPALATEIGQFNAVLIDEAPKNKQDLHELVKIFVDPDYKDGVKSDWFASLKKQDRVRWRNAVKYFVDIVNKKAP